MPSYITNPADPRLDVLTPRLADTAERVLRGDHLELIADMFGVSRDTVAKRYHRARKTLPALPPLHSRCDFAAHIQAQQYIDRRVVILSA